MALGPEPTADGVNHVDITHPVQIDANHHYPGSVWQAGAARDGTLDDLPVRTRHVESYDYVDETLLPDA